MSVCALCLKNAADKKGSHLIPHFLMKRIDNVDGRPGRELELGFELSGGKVSGYFGSSVLPERLEPVFGELSQDELDNSRSKLIVDELLCTACEKRLGDLESEYAQALQKSRTPDCFRSLLFWSSIFWRMSVSDTKAYKMNVQDETLLRTTLDSGLNEKNMEVSSIRYELIRCINYTDKNTAKVLFKNENTEPYAALIGEFAVFLTVDPPKSDGAGQVFLGLEKLRKDAKINTWNEGEFVLQVSTEVFDDAYKQGADFWINDFNETVDEVCEAVHKMLLGSGGMDPAIKHEVLHALVHDERPMGRKYTPEAIHAAIMKIIFNYEPYKYMIKK